MRLPLFLCIFLDFLPNLYIMAANFLCVPLKSTNEVDLYKPLKTYLDSLTELTDELRMEASEGLTELNKLRNRACCQPLDKHQSSLDVLTRFEPVTLYTFFGFLFLLLV